MTDVTPAVEETEKKVVRKPPFKKLTINALLDMSLGTPVNLDEYREYQAELEKFYEEAGAEIPIKENIPVYRGWMRYDIGLFDSLIVVVARKHPDNQGWQIRDWTPVPR